MLLRWLVLKPHPGRATKANTCRFATLIHMDSAEGMSGAHYVHIVPYMSSRTSLTLAFHLSLSDMFIFLYIHEQQKAWWATSTYELTMLPNHRPVTLAKHLDMLQSSAENDFSSRAKSQHQHAAPSRSQVTAV
jgi:hypothetical protein